MSQPINVDKSKIIFQSAFYPHEYQEFKPTTCTVELPPNVAGRLEIMDMSHNISFQISPYCLQVEGIGSQIQCAANGHLFPILNIPASVYEPQIVKIHLKRTSQNVIIGAAFWIMLSGKYSLYLLLFNKRELRTFSVTT